MKKISVKGYVEEVKSFLRPGETQPVTTVNAYVQMGQASDIITVPAPVETRPGNTIEITVSVRE